MDLTMILIFFVVSLISFHYYTHNSRRGKLIDEIPGPKWFPLIGNLIDVLVPLEDLWNFLRRCGRDHYPIYKFWLGNWGVVNIVNADDAEVLLSSTKNIEKSVFYDYLHPWLQTGLLTSTGSKWKSRRKFMTPAFHLNILQEYFDSISESTNRTISLMKLEASSGSVEKNLLPMVTAFTLNTICESIMGATLKENDPEAESYRHAIYEIGEIFYYRAPRPWLKSDWIFGRTAKGHDQNKALKVLHKFSTKIIEERQQYHEQQGIKDWSKIFNNSELNEMNGKNGKRKRLAFLDLLIDASKRGLGIDNQGIREEVDTFVFEGHDTTAMSLFFTILLLAEHKDIQGRARAEVEEILKDCNGKLSSSEIQRMTYLECCIKESLRLYPSVPAISRKTSEDLQLKNALIPKGTIVNVQIIDVHRDAKYWPRPNVFDPERFLPKNIEGRHPFSYIPFSGGPRNCIGQKFAMLELKTFIAGLLANFHFEQLEEVANVIIYPDLVLRPAYPTYVRFTPINK